MGNDFEQYLLIRLMELVSAVVQKVQECLAISKYFVTKFRKG